MDVVRRFAPFARSRYKFGLQMGLRPTNTWLVGEASDEVQLAEKKALFDDDKTRNKIIAAVDGSSQAAQQELLRAVEQATPAEQASPFCTSSSATTIAPLERAARRCCEDLCILQRSDAGWRLTAAAVCFPTLWTLHSKMGRDIAFIHDPVPGFADTRLTKTIERAFDKLPAGQIRARANWSMMTDPTLFQPGSHYSANDAAAGVTAHNAGERVYLRIERQCIRKLPETGAVAFTIRVAQCTLGEAACVRVLQENQNKEAAPPPLLGARLLEELTRMREESPDMWAYKSLPHIGDAVMGYLQQEAIEEAAA